MRKTLSGFTFHFIKQIGAKFALIQLFCLAWTFDATLWPVWNMALIDKLTEFPDDRSAIFSQIWPLLALGAGLWLSLELSFRLGGILIAKTFPGMESKMRLSLFDYVQRHSYNFFSNQMAGSLSNKINELPPCITRIYHLMMMLFIPVGLAVLIAITIFTMVEPLFGLLLAVWISVHMAISLYFARRCDHLSHVHAEARSDLAGRIVDSLSNYINTKLFARYSYELEYIRKHQVIEQKKHETSLMFLEMVKIPLGIVGFLLPGVILIGLTIYYWSQSAITTGEVVYILNGSANIMMMAWIAGLELPNFYKEIGVAKQALKLIQEPHEIIDERNAKKLVVTKGEIGFNNVTFHYNPNQALFKDKSLVIASGEKVGLVGFSGSGKTSFINLILRHFDVEKGEILIDGQNIAKVTIESLREAIAMIPQEPVLFHRSLMENIRYGRLSATDDEVIEAAKRAHCHEFISRLPDGYNTLVGERGLKLSGGQRQRIAIARAVLKNAPILILDEATSALDSMTEKQIQDGLKELMAGRTAIVIAHRLSTIAHLDRILVFESGQVLEEGTHEELLRRNGRYAEMWQMQAGGFLPAEQDLYQESQNNYNEPQNYHPR